MTTISSSKHGIAMVFILAIGCATVVSSATAAPVRLSAIDFVTQVSGSPSQIESFESFDPGFSANPFVFTNGTYTSIVGESSIIFAPSFCGAASQCLSNSRLDGAKIFDAFPVGTTHFGVDFRTLSSLDTFEFTVTGGSGVATFIVDGADFFVIGFLGWFDALGISSVEVLNLGHGSGFTNFTFDNVRTAQVVPLPAPFWLLAMALVALARKRE